MRIQMHQKLDGKVALVTGAGRGIGRAIAVRLGMIGADVIVHDLHRESSNDFGEAMTIDEVSEAIGELGRKSITVTGDLTDSAAASSMVDDALRTFPRIDILVNNAGGDIAADGRGKAVPNDMFVPEADLHAILNRNLLSTVHTSRAVVRHMLDGGKGGRIVNIASLAGLAATTTEMTYGIAKAGVIHYSRCLATQLRGHGITVNAVAPGGIKSARWMATIDSRGGAKELLGEARPLLRLGTPEDVAAVVEFFVTDLSEYVTGEVLRVDGGFQTNAASGGI